MLISDWQSSPDRFAVTMLFAKSKASTTEWMLVLAKRTDHLRTHSGQIGMPGGRISEGDDSPMTTAFRETHEELGIPLSALDFRGYLEQTFTLNGGILQPCAAVTSIPVEEFTPNPDEVAQLVIAPWQSYQRGRADAVRFNYFGHWRNSVSFQVNHQRIWGLTAGILYRANLR
jgi:8-oxo-dGTP pyrophosphatase MutT (NUDIX family)